MRKQHLYHIVRLFAVLAVVAGGTAATVPRVQAAASPVRVPAGVEWVKTGIIVTEGQEVYLDAQGVAITAPLVSFPAAISGPDGQEWNLGCGEYEGAPPPCALEHAPYGALVGRVGPFGSPFLIGGSPSFIPPASGALYLTVNDNLISYWDNLAGFTVLFGGK
jgi:hypothetical protein